MSAEHQSRAAILSLHLHLLAVMAEAEGRPHVGGERPGDQLDTEGRAEQEEAGGAQQVQQVPPAPPQHDVAAEVDHREQSRNTQLSQSGNGRQTSRRHKIDEAEDDRERSTESQADNKAKSLLSWQESEGNKSVFLRRKNISPVKEAVSEEPD